MMHKKFTFKNGLRLVTVPMKGTKAVTVLVLVSAGSKYEQKSNNGISHFLEHMFFKGTRKRPNTLAIAETLDRVGGEYNAFTAEEYTGYWAKVENKHLDIALNWVSDIFLNSKLDTKEIEKEKGVIIEEINMYLDTPAWYIADLWADLLYGNQPAGWRVLGREEVIRKLKRQNLVNYLNNHYSAHNTIVIVAGELDSSLLKRVKEYFNSINTTKPKTKKRVMENQKKPGLLVHYKKTDQTHLFLGVRAYDIFDERKYAQGLLAVILGGNMSSRIWLELRGKRGLAYNVSTSADSHTDTGCLYTRTGVDNKRVDEAVQIILKNYKLIKEKKISQKELRKAKDFIKGKSVLSLESSDAIASFVGGQEILTGKILTPEEKFAKIEAVTINDIYEVANDIFKPEKLNLALIGPFKDKRKFQKLCQGQL